MLAPSRHFPNSPDCASRSQPRLRTFRKGFTLMELLIVVAILGILAAFVAPALTDAVDQSDYIQCESQREVLRRAKSLYVVDHLGVSSDGELPQFRFLYLNIPVSLTEDNRGVLRAYCPERFEFTCPRAPTDVEYTQPYNLFHVSTCPYCAANPR